MLTYTASRPRNDPRASASSYGALSVLCLTCGGGDTRNSKQPVLLEEVNKVLAIELASSGENRDNEFGNRQECDRLAARRRPHRPLIARLAKRSYF